MRTSFGMKNGRISSDMLKVDVVDTGVVFLSCDINRPRMQRSIRSRSELCEAQSSLNCCMAVGTKKAQSHIFARDEVECYMCLPRSGLAVTKFSYPRCVLEKRSTSVGPVFGG